MRFGVPMDLVSRDIVPFRLGRWISVYLVAGIYFFACTRPAYLVFQTEVDGWTALAQAWLFAPFLLPWSANIWLLIGGICLLRGHYRPAVVFGMIAFLAASFLAVLDHGANLLEGYWLWLVSMACLLIFSAALWFSAWITSER
jgi:hypothetical protein